MQKMRKYESYINLVLVPRYQLIGFVHLKAMG